MMPATVYGRRKKIDHAVMSKEQELASKYPLEEEIVGDIELELLTMNG
jgi:hypothetical protein